MQIFQSLSSQHWWPCLLLLASLLIFLISWLHEPRRLINGVLFTICLFCLAGWLSWTVATSRNQALTICYWFLIGLIVACLLSLILFAWIFLIWNGLYVWQRESHTLPNLLSLILGISLVAVSLFIVFDLHRYLPAWINWLALPIPSILVYLSLTAYNFLINLLLYQFVPRHYQQDYLIVLGAGLLHGRQISRLLAARIDRAIAFAHKQVALGRPMPKFIMSGGQGPDEELSEAAAMKNYAAEHGISREMILLEDQSTNTLQNMQFSKAAAEKDFGSNHFHATFFSNNFHILRAGLLARKVNLPANGIGAPTRFYYLPNAIIREMASVFVMNKKRHLTVIILLTIVILGEAALSSLGIHLF